MSRRKKGEIKKISRQIQAYIWAFSRITGIHESTLCGYSYESKMPSLINAIIIVAATNHRVEFIDLVPTRYRARIHRNFGPDHHKNLL